ncbi:SKP1/BTB/POZ domain-containing protein [Orpheovirus IHUMI-LCC2]|uniref:SKP1/BTB/POZ domain-containing protein n=1 Tax=Orpheovirus IHUMI-LCC2 TaxID=2023057 RepID=A0A2I2L4Y5_9VIRU|nr:SKP1/BTB/POZ domain-containing protein [Orpheovirus IHUMI-LCC2]SNW62612.1 SKP1/BTB/POZ domain-containing protein [Orpheovirus IHUMI-LCC2]
MSYKIHLYNNSLFSDIKIKCKNEGGKETQWYAHKIIICEYSKVLHKKFTIDMKDKHEDTIYVDWEPSVTEFILKYMYDHPNRYHEDDMEQMMKIYKASHYWEVNKICSYIEHSINKKINDGCLDTEKFIFLYTNGILYENIKNLLHRYTRKYFLSLSSELSVITLEDIQYALFNDIQIQDDYEIFVKLKEWGKINKNKYEKEELISLIKKRINFDTFTINQMKKTNMKKYCNNVEDTKSPYESCNGHALPNLVVSQPSVDTFKHKIQADPNKSICQNVGRGGQWCSNNVKTGGYDYCSAHVTQRERKGLSAKFTI